MRSSGPFGTSIGAIASPEARLQFVRVTTCHSWLVSGPLCARLESMAIVCMAAFAGLPIASANVSLKSRENFSKSPFRHPLCRYKPNCQCKCLECITTGWDCREKLPWANVRLTEGSLFSSGTWDIGVLTAVTSNCRQEKKFPDRRIPSWMPDFLCQTLET